LAPPPAPTPVFNPPGLLTEHWQQYVKLAGETPSPAVYSPHLWRRYQDTLTRYEELLQAGATDNAHALEIRLREYGDLIRRGRTVSLGSVGNSLSMADVAGMENPVSPTTDRALDELWKAFPKEHGKKWAELLAAADGQPGGRTGLRLRLTERLLKRAADDPGQNLTTAYHLLRTLDDPLNPRPVEAHLLIMLHRDLPRKDPASAASPPLLPARLISLALHVRVRAERAAVGLTSADDQSVPADPYPYCAQVVPWIRNRIEEADRLRRLGQDLLFSTDKLKWKEAEELLGNADRQYRLAQDEAVRVRAALAVRDRVLAAVPRYADWLARQASGLQPAGLADGLLEQLERLCKDAHTLADRLEKAPALQAPPEETDAQYLDLAEQANAVRRGLDAIEARFRPYVEKLFATQDSPALWRSLDDLLTVPASDVKRRMELLVRKSQVSRKFFDATLHVKGGPPGVEARTVEEMGKKSAEVRGRLALALLGDRCFNELGREPNDTAEMVRKSLGPFRAGEAWWQSIDSAGEQIGRRWRLLPAEIAKRLPEKGLKAVGPQAIPNLETAARLTRLVDGPGSLFPVLLSRNPVAEYRDHLVRDLVLWQADRMLRDYWHEEDAIKVPYFRAAGRVFVGDARQLDPFGLRSERIRQVEQELAKDWNGRLFLDVGAKPLPPTPSPEGRGGEELTGSPSPFGGGGWGEGFPQGPSVLHMTGEEEFPLRYRLQVNGNLAGLAGHPVVWVDAGQALEMRVPAAGQRMALSVGERPEPLRCVVTSPLLRQAELKPPDVPKATESSVTVHGLYRGRHFSVSTRLLLHPLPDVTLSVLPPPLNASLAVRAPREVVQGTPPRGALAIVLDCSGSMAAVPGQPPESSKFAEAADAVRRVLRQLPQGLLVSVWVFGQAIDPGKTTNTPEETIQKLLEP
ncbi:MAG TPA: hypothetical protein VEL76_08720, partial [Gemmataceae bacterium]|nr:hypothetical protein [Gemmataceae bacterium]